MEVPYKAIIDNCILKSELITKKKESKIKDFLSEISSDALSDTASSTLSTLLMFLFKKIIF